MKKNPHTSDEGSVRLSERSIIAAIIIKQQKPIDNAPIVLRRTL